jgi:cytochrome c oxidase subunit IV
MMDDKEKNQIYEKGIFVLIILASLTIGELWFALFGITWWSILILIALGKAFLVVRDYMHIGRLFTEEEH